MKSRRMACSLMGFSIALKFIIALKILYFSQFDGIRPMKSNMLWDDGGVMASSMVAFDHPEIKREKWYQLITQEIDETYLIKKWGPWGCKIPYSMKTWPGNPYLLFNWAGSLLHASLGNYQRVLFAFFLLLPALILLKYLLLIGMLRENWAPILSIMAYLDLVQPYGHSYYWFVSSAYAHLLLSFGLCLRFFWKSPRRVLLSYAFLIPALLTSGTTLSVVLGIGLADLLGSAPFSPRWKSSLGELDPKRLFWMVFALLVATIPFAFLQLILNLWNQPDRFVYFLQFFQQAISYYRFQDIALYFAFSYLLALFQKSDSTISHSKLSVLLMVAISFLYVASSPWLSYQAQANVHRFNEFNYVFMVFALGYLLLRLDPLPYGKVIQGAWIIAAIFGTSQMLPAYTGPAITGVARYSPFQEGDYATLSRESDGFEYFLASHPQHVYNYLMNLDFRKAPLVLDIETPRYSPEKALESIRGR